MYFNIFIVTLVLQKQHSFFLFINLKMSLIQRKTIGVELM